MPAEDSMEEEGPVVEQKILFFYWFGKQCFLGHLYQFTGGIVCECGVQPSTLLFYRSHTDETLGLAVGQRGSDIGDGMLDNNKDGCVVKVMFVR